MDTDDTRSRGAEPTPHPEPLEGAAKLSLRVVEDLRELSAHVAEWQDLAAAALEPNPFYEPWMLLPAASHLGAGKTLLAVLVFAEDPARPGAPLLTGLFPLESRRRYKGLPIRHVRLWRHLHCFLTTPLIRAGYARETWQAFFGWLASDPRSGALFELSLIAGDGPCHQALIDHLHRSSRPSRVDECYTRALFRPGADAESDLAGALSGRHRRKIKRQEKQLAELGHLEYDALGPKDDVEKRIEEFLALEASGWKGRAGDALAAREVERSYFRAIVGEAFRSGRLSMLALRLDGRPIAYKCDFLAGRGAFTFKIAFDESYARYSPGLLLEIHAIQRLHAQSAIEWVDSCTHPANFMFNRIWLERRTIETLLVSTGKAPGDLVVSMLPLLAWLRGKLARAKRRPPEQPR
jgi:CelD/BcsL family acetyltransferase involved in cellulose biosynthesis